MMVFFQCYSLPTMFKYYVQFVFSDLKYVIHP